MCCDCAQLFCFFVSSRRRHTILTCDWSSDVCSSDLVRDGAVAEHPPDAVVWPETTEEVAEIVRIARRLRVPVVPYGAGSGVAGGAVPIHGGITVDVKRMDRVLEIDERDLTVHAECGINGERFERELARKG